MSSVGKLLIKSKLDPLYVMAKLDGRAQLQVHALLNGGKGKEQKGLPIDLLLRTKNRVNDMRTNEASSWQFRLALP